MSAARTPDRHHKRRLRAAIFALLLLAFVSGPVWSDEWPPPLSRGHVFFQGDFEGQKALDGWSVGGELGAGYQSAHSLHLASKTDSKNGSATVSRELPVAAMRGCVINCAAMVKAAGVSDKPHPWNGIKCMLVVETPSGKQWPQAAVGTGSFDWQRVSFAVRVPEDASRITLVLGLEAVTGEVWFDDLRISVRRPPLAALPPAAAKTMFTGHALPRRRGAMVSPDIDEAGLQTLGRTWNANLIRWQLVRHAAVGQSATPAAYDAWLAGELKRLDAALPLCEKYGLEVVIDLHSPPGGQGISGGYAAANAGLFTERASQDKLVQVWEGLAKRYLNARAVWGYDLVNEPDDVGVSEACADWQELAERTAKAVRAIDPQRAIIVEPAGWGGPEGLAGFRPLLVPGIVYSVHMYIPGAFTHQGVLAPSAPVVYPGQIEGQRWDKARLELALKPVVEFQKAYGVQIYVGEFSAIRWAPGQSACNYLRDVIEIFESHGWDWTYHAFREWPGWSVEHTGDRNDTKPAAEPTDREKLLRQWFSKNQKPAAVQP